MLQINSTLNARTTSTNVCRQNKYKWVFFFSYKSRREEITFLKSPVSLTTRRPSSTPRVCTDGVRSYADVITKFSRLDELPIFLKYGASLRVSRAEAPLKIAWDLKWLNPNSPYITWRIIKCLIPRASPRPLSSGENTLSAGLDYMRQKRERTGTSFYNVIDWIKNLNISTDIPSLQCTQYERQSERSCPAEPGALIGTDCALTGHNNIHFLSSQLKYRQCLSCFGLF